MSSAALVGAEYSAGGEVGWSRAAQSRAVKAAAEASESPEGEQGAVGAVVARMHALTGGVRWSVARQGLTMAATRASATAQDCASALVEARSVGSASTIRRREIMLAGFRGEAV